MDDEDPPAAIDQEGAEALAKLNALRRMWFGEPWKRDAHVVRSAPVACVRGPAPYLCPHCGRDKAICRRHGLCSAPWEWPEHWRRTAERNLGRKLPDRDPKAVSK